MVRLEANGVHAAALGQDGDLLRARVPRERNRHHRGGPLRLFPDRLRKDSGVLGGARLLRGRVLLEAKRSEIGVMPLD